MTHTRRVFLKSAGGIAVVASAEKAPGLNLAAERKASESKAIPLEPFFSYQVTVRDNNGGAGIDGATVHLEPRQSGLPYTYDQTTANGGVAIFNIATGDAGYYDIEAYHGQYEDGANLQEWVGTGQSDFVYLDHI